MARTTLTTPKKSAPLSKKVPPDPSDQTGTRHTSPVVKKLPVSLDPATFVVKEGEEPWTREEIHEIVTELEEQRAHSSKLIETQEAELSGLMKDSGDGAGQDQADMGATSFERDQELSVVNSEKDKLAQIERALGRIDDGTYGVCEAAGEPIGKLRLMAFPRATLCMQCKTREERR